MNKLAASCTLIVALLEFGAPDICGAQEPGTNMATAQQPGPAVAPAAVGNADATPQLPVTSVAQEPVIDTSTTHVSLPNRPLLITGAIILGASYAGSAIVAASSSRTADEKLYYPVVGPWMDLDERDCDINRCNNRRLNQGLLIGDGIVQGLGALTLLMGLIVPEKTTRHWYLIGQSSLFVLPQLDADAIRVRAVGRF
jgi:hypothetical protein